MILPDEADDDQRSAIRVIPRAREEGKPRALGYMLIGAEPEVATGAFGLDQATLLTKALSAPSAKAATAAMMMARSIPGR